MGEGMEAGVLLTMAMVVVSSVAGALLLRMEEEGAAAIVMEVHHLVAHGKEIEAAAVVDDQIMIVSVIDPAVAVQIADTVVDAIERLHANSTSERRKFVVL